MSKSSPPPSADHKAWAGILRARAGDSARVHVYYDDPHQRSIAVFSGRIGSDHVASTIGLMDLNQSRKDGKEIHAEVLMERGGSDTFLGRVLSTIAFCALKDGWQIAPDRIFEKVVSMYEPDTHLPHVMFVPIFRWTDMSQVQVGSRTIHPLLAIPISQAEADLSDREGAGVLLSRLESCAADVNDWRRASVA